MGVPIDTKEGILGGGSGVGVAGEAAAVNSSRSRKRHICRVMPSSVLNRASHRDRL